MTGNYGMAGDYGTAGDMEMTGEAGMTDWRLTVSWESMRRHLFPFDAIEPSHRFLRHVETYPPVIPAQAGIHLSLPHLREGSQLHAISRYLFPGDL